MPKAYNNDLRHKVIAAIELNGMKRCEVSELFEISRNTIHQWFQLKAETGDIQPKPTKQRGHSHKITDWDKFRAFVSANPDQTQTEMTNIKPRVQPSLLLDLVGEVIYGLVTVIHLTTNRTPIYG